MTREYWVTFILRRILIMIIYVLLGTWLIGLLLAFTGNTLVLLLLIPIAIVFYVQSIRLHRHNKQYHRKQIVLEDELHVIRDES